MPKVLKFRKLSQIKAKSEVSDFILKEKKRGEKTLNTLDVVLNLKIPAPQIEKILEEFLKENKIKEING